MTAGTNRPSTAKGVANALMRAIEKQQRVIDAGDIATIRFTVRLNPRTGTVMKTQTQIEMECDERTS